MEIKGNISNNMTYEGKLKVKYRNNGKTYEIHNSGTQDLMNLITEALLTGDIKNKIPKFLGFNKIQTIETDVETEEGGSTTEATITRTSLVRNRIPLTAITRTQGTDPTNPQSSLNLTATILPTDIYAIDGGVTTGGLELVIYGLNADFINNDDSILATITDDATLASMYNAICTGVEAIIEWQMIFKCEKKEVNS